MLTNKEFDRATFRRSVVNNIKNMFRKTIDEATLQQVLQAITFTVKGVAIDEWIASHKEYEKKDVRTVYHLSMEFLMGRALGSNIINICTHGKIKEVLDELGPDLSVIEDQKPDAALGNGGLGRLAACFLDSLAALDYPAYGCGIRYRYGMSKQKIEDGHRIRVLGEWLKDSNPFEVHRPEYAQEVKLGGYMRIENTGGVDHFVQDGYQTVRAVPYGLLVIDHDNNVVNILCIWDAGPVDTSNLDSFDRGDYQEATKQENLAKTIVEAPYPNDNHYVGEELCLKQQYFFISANIQRAITKYKKRYEDIHKFREKVIFQLNDTHPTVVIPELTRIFLDEKGLTREEAQDVATRTYAYTNHTIMSEALKKWPIGLFLRLLPCTYQIVERINRRFQSQIQSMHPGNRDKLRNMSTIYNDQMKAAYMVTTANFSMNGVARLHIEVLKNQELKGSCQMMPEKFNNKTNGIAQRRFLFHGDPLLVDWVTSKIGDKQIISLPHIKELEIYADDEKCQQELLNVKCQNKIRLVEYIREHNGIDTDPCSIFDVQVKRFHEYKCQLMNILHMMYLYNQLKGNPEMDMVPRTFIFSAKATAGYKRAKLTVKLINFVMDVINNDRFIGGKTRAMFIENYRVSNIELISVAVGVSEQILTASREASDTGDIKLMFNDILILDTTDGANVEIMEEVDQEYVSAFGISPSEVINYGSNGGYYLTDIFSNDQEIRRVLMQSINGHYVPDNPELFRGIYNLLLNTKSSDKADTHLTLRGLRSYAQIRGRVGQAFRNEKWWTKAAILNISGSGKFTPDRAIKECVRNIWHLEKVIVEM